MYFGVMLTGYFMQFFNNRFFLIIFTLILAILGFFRYGIGIDYFAYQFLYDRLLPNIFEEIKYGVDFQETGFRALGSFLKGLGFSYQAYLIVLMSVTMFFMYKIVKRYSLNPTLSMLLFFCFYYLTWTFSGVRQGLVIAVGLYFLLKYIEEKKGIRLVVVSILLSFIHTSALSLILYYLLSKLNFNRKSLIVITIFSVIVSFLPTGNLVSQMTFLPFFSDLFPYIETGVGVNFLDFQSISRLVFLAVALIFYNVYADQNEMSKKIMNIYIFSTIIYLLFQFSELTAARIAIFGKFLDIIIFANVLYLYRESINKLLYIYAIFILCSLYLVKEVDTQITSTVENNSILAPYPTVFNGDDSRYNYLNSYKNLTD